MSDLGKGKVIDENGQLAQIVARAKSELGFPQARENGRGGPVKLGRTESSQSSGEGSG